MNHKLIQSWNLTYYPRNCRLVTECAVVSETEVEDMTCVIMTQEMNQR